MEGADGVEFRMILLQLRESQDRAAAHGKSPPPSIHGGCAAKASGLPSNARQLRARHWIGLEDVHFDALANHLVRHVEVTADSASHDFAASEIIAVEGICIAVIARRWPVSST